MSLEELLMKENEDNINFGDDVANEEDEEEKESETENQTNSSDVNTRKIMCQRSA